MSFTFERLAIPEVILIEPKVFGDARGFFMETYKHSDFSAFGLTEPLVQENHSKSGRGSLRGLHYQRAPQGQAKLVRVVAGEIFDVAVDVRHDSPTRGKMGRRHALSGQSADAVPSALVRPWILRH